MISITLSLYVFFYNDTAPTKIYPLPLPAPLPTSLIDLSGASPTGLSDIHARRWDEEALAIAGVRPEQLAEVVPTTHRAGSDRKSTRLNSSHANISYAVFCLKKKKTQHVS